MKTSLLVVVGLFLSHSYALACPNLAGTFVSTNFNSQVTIVATQTACTSMNFLVTTLASNGATSGFNYYVPTDNLLHKVGSPNGIDEYMAMHFEGNQLDSIAVWAQNAAPTPMITSSTDIFTLDESGNLVDSISTTSGVGATAVNQVVYTRKQ